MTEFLSRSESWELRPKWKFGKVTWLAQDHTIHSPLNKSTSFLLTGSAGLYIVYDIQFPQNPIACKWQKLLVFFLNSKGTLIVTITEKLRDGSQFLDALLSISQFLFPCTEEACRRTCSQVVTNGSDIADYSSHLQDWSQWKEKILFPYVLKSQGRLPLVNSYVPGRSLAYFDS